MRSSRRVAKFKQNPEPSSQRVLFLMDQIAGHVTNYQNLRRVIDADEGIDPVWAEIAYYKVGGRIEVVREKWLRFIPAYASGVIRGALEARRWMRRLHW